MATTRDWGQYPIVAKDAITPLPPTPVQTIAYRNAAIPDVEVEAGTGFFTRPISSTDNELLFRITRALRDLDQGGLLGWSDKTDYITSALTRGSDGKLYRAVQPSGPATVIQDPVPINPTYWLIEHQGGFQAGDYKCTGTLNVPSGGWLYANGQIVSRATYFRLYAEYGDRYGAGDGLTTFKLPDWRGMFPRGLDDSRGIDVGRALNNTYQAAQVQPHKHVGGVIYDGTNFNPQFGSLSNVGGAAITTGGVLGGFPAMTNDGSDIHGIVNPPGVIGTETRPDNMAWVVWVKY